MEIEPATMRREPVTTRIPEALREGRQLGAQHIAIDLIEVGMATQPEQREEVAVFEATYAGELQFQQCGLTRIGVHRIDATRAEQGVVQHIAAGAGDDQQPILGSQCQRLPVNRRVFPASVVNQRPRIHRIENLLIDAIGKCQLRGHCAPVDVMPVARSQRKLWGCDDKAVMPLRQRRDIDTRSRSQRQGHQTAACLSWRVHMTSGQCARRDPYYHALGVIGLMLEQVFSNAPNPWALAACATLAMALVYGVARRASRVIASLSARAWTPSVARVLAHVVRSRDTDETRFLCADGAPERYIVPRRQALNRLRTALAERAPHSHAWAEHLASHCNSTNQLLHLLSSATFIFCYWLVFSNLVTAMWLGLAALFVRQLGHALIEPPCHDKEQLLLGFDTRAKTKVVGIYLLIPLLNAVHAAPLDAASLATLGASVAQQWFAFTALVVFGHVARLTPRHGLRNALVWLVKLVTDPITDIFAYYPTLLRFARRT